MGQSKANKIGAFPDCGSAFAGFRGSWVPFGCSGALALFRFVGARSMAREHGLIWPGSTVCEEKKISPNESLNSGVLFKNGSSSPN